MTHFLVKALLSGIIVAAVSETARRSPGPGALVVSLPLISIVGMIWLWRNTGDKVRMAAHAEATSWYVVPSLPMFLVIPALLRHAVGFWPALIAGCLLPVALFALMSWVLPGFGIAA